MRLESALFLMLAALVASAAATEASLSLEAFQERLDHAAELNVTAPWRESQEVLDQLRPYLDQATDEQYADFKLLDIRNQILAGEPEGGVERLEELLERDLVERQEIRAAELAANASIVARRYEQAFAFLERALTVAREIDPHDRPAMVFNLAAYMYAKVGQTERAREYGSYAADYFRDSDNMRGRCVSLQRLAFVYKVDEEYETARRLYREALESCLEAADQVLTGVVESGLADLLRRAGEYEDASKLFEQALPRLEKADFRAGVAELHLYRARFHYALGEYTQVIDLLEPVIGFYHDNETWDYLAEANQMLGSIAVSRSEYEQAIEYFKAETSARERFLDMNRIRQLAYLEVEFDTELKEQELDLLREQARVQELEAETRKQQQHLQTFGYGLAAFLVISLFLLLAHVTRERRHYRRLSRRDGLTGLNNHTRFFELADPAFEAAQRNGSSFALVLADVDHFKQVNDEHGHLVGDEVLRRIAARIHEVFGDEGIIGRIGGEEFAVALVGTDRRKVQGLVNRLRDSLQNARTGDPGMGVSLSFGAAILDGEHTLNELRERADLALYRAKNAGRDRLVFADARDY